MAPSVEFYGQPFEEGGSAGPFLARLLDDPRISSLTIVVAWVRYRGLLRLKDKLIAFRSRGGVVRIIVGVDEGGATRPGLIGVVRMSDEAYVFHDPSGGTFHPKVYLGEGDQAAVLFVGSSNLTPGGLFVNVEASVATEFQLPAEREHSALVHAQQFISSLREDPDACRLLTETAVDEMYADKRYKIAGHEQNRRGGAANTPEVDPADIDEPDPDEAPDQKQTKFSPSRKSRITVPSLTQADRDELAALELDVPDASAASEASVTDVWTKELRRSDAQQVAPGSKRTGVLRLTQEHHELNHQEWFRQTLFGSPVSWTPAFDRGGNKIELAQVPFHVRIKGVDRGTIVLTVDHGPHREALQGNVPTLIHWGPLSADMRAADYSGETLTLERLSDATYRLTIG
jgi:hypothetical protein